MSDAQVATAIGVSPRAYNYYVNDDRRPSYEGLVALARFHGVSIDYILTGQPGPREPEMHVPLRGDAKIRNQDYAAIPVYEVDAAAGNGIVPLSEAAPDSIAFTRAWLMRHGIVADLAGILRVRGDSMAPTIPDGAHVLVDFRARAEDRPAGVCVLRHDGEIRVKRLFWPQRDGERWVAMVSDNPAHVPIFIHNPERPAFEPLARVRAILSLV